MADGMLMRFAKAMRQIRHAGLPPLLLGRLARTRFDYAKEVGDGIDSSVVTAPIQWIQRAMPEGRLRVVRGRGDELEEVENHPLVELIGQPNGHYGDAALWSATIMSWCVAGNGFWLKARNGVGKTAELWYAPHWTLTPKWPADGSEFISHYEYRPGGGVAPITIQPQDLVHFRHGIDPRNLRLGISPLHGVIREIFMDLEASNFVASLLRNVGVPGAVISPKNGTVDPDDVAATKAWFKQAFAGDRRGEPLVMGAPTDVSSFSFNPQQMDLSSARDVAEERVCAALGIPAAVVGFGAGLQTAKVGATMGELRQLAWTNGVIPLMRQMADELQRAFAGELLQPGERIEFDTSNVAALAEAQLQKAQQWAQGVQAGAVLVAEFRERLGLDVDDSHRVFLRPFASIEVPDGTLASDQTLPDADDPEAAGLTWSDLKRKLREDKQPRRASGESLRRGRAYAERLRRIERPLTAAAEKRLAAFFEKLGRSTRAPAIELLRESVVEEAAAIGRALEGKVDPPSGADRILVERIIEQLELPLRQQDLARIYEAHYLAVAEEVAKAGELIGLATDLPDPVARAVVAAGGRRAGLVDLSAQSRQALFDALAEGRAAGEGVEQLTRRIVQAVEGGPWQEASTRARTIARTETKYAQNVSTMARAQNAGVQRFIVFDGRLGPGRSDPDHIARDGTIVDAQEANRLAAAEHPNGTLSLSPYLEEE